MVVKKVVFMIVTARGNGSDEERWATPAVFYSELLLLYR
jgi:hypothetical protein